MPTPIPPERLPGLRKALASYGPDDKVSLQQIAEHYGVVSSRLSTLINRRLEGFPPAEKRDDKTHWYNARAALTALIAFVEGTTKRKVAAAARHTEIMTGVTATKEAAATAAAAEPAPLSAADIDRLAGAQAKIWKLAKDQGLYALKADVRASNRRVGSILVRGVTSIPGRVDPNGQWSPEQRTTLERALREILSEIHDELRAVCGADEQDDEPARSGGRTAATDERRRNRRSG